MTRPGISSSNSPGRKIGRVVICSVPIVPSEAAPAVPTRFALRPAARTVPISLSGVALAHGAGDAAAASLLDGEGALDGHGEAAGTAAGVESALASANTEK